MARVVVDVMPKPEILDPQGKAVTGSLQRLGYQGLTVRQGKRFEIEVDGELTDEKLAQVHEAAERLLANTVIETFDVYVEMDEDCDCEACSASGEGCDCKPGECTCADGECKCADGECKCAEGECDCEPGECECDHHSKDA